MRWRSIVDPIQLFKLLSLHIFQVISSLHLCKNGNELPKLFPTDRVTSLDMPFSSRIVMALGFKGLWIVWGMSFNLRLYKILTALCYSWHVSSAKRACPEACGGTATIGPNGTVKQILSRARGTIHARWLVMSPVDEPWAAGSKILWIITENLMLVSHDSDCDNLKRFYSLNVQYQYVS